MMTTRIVIGLDLSSKQQLLVRAEAQRTGLKCHFSTVEARSLILFSGLTARPCSTVIVVSGDAVHLNPVKFEELAAIADSAGLLACLVESSVVPLYLFTPALRRGIHVVAPTTSEGVRQVLAAEMSERASRIGTLVRFAALAAGLSDALSKAIVAEGVQMNVNQWARAAGISRRTLHRRVHRETGVSPHDLLVAFRLHLAAEFCGDQITDRQLSHWAGFPSEVALRRARNGNSGPLMKCK